MRTKRQPVIYTIIYGLHPNHTASAMVIMIVAERCKNPVDIDEHPAIVESRRRIGDWEGDTVMGKGLKSALLTMLERKTLYTVIICLTGKQSGLLAEAAVAGLKALKSNILTIILNNGLEFADHDIIAQGLDANIYFAHPYCSWERGIN